MENKIENDKTIDIMSIRREVEKSQKTECFVEKIITNEVLEEYHLEAIRLTEEYLQNLKNLTTLINHNLLFSKNNCKELSETLENSVQTFINHLKKQREKNLQSVLYKEDKNIHKFCKGAGLNPIEIEVCKMLFFDKFSITKIADVLEKDDKTIEHYIRCILEKFYKHFRKSKEDKLMKLYFIRHLKRNNTYNGSKIRFRSGSTTIIKIFKAFFSEI